MNRVCAGANGFSNTRKLLEFRPWENEGSWEFQQHLIRDDNFYLVSCSTSFRVIVHLDNTDGPLLPASKLFCQTSSNSLHHLLLPTKQLQLKLKIGSYKIAACTNERKMAPRQDGLLLRHKMTRRQSSFCRCYETLVLGLRPIVPSRTPLDFWEG